MCKTSNIDEITMKIKCQTTKISHTIISTKMPSLFLIILLKLIITLFEIVAHYYIKTIISVLIIKLKPKRNYDGSIFNLLGCSNCSQDCGKYQRGTLA